MLDKTQEELELGTVAGTGRTVIAMTKIKGHIEGDTYAFWITICFDATSYHPYVVTQVFARPEGWSCGNGDYFANLNDALLRYYEKGGSQDSEIVI